MKLTRIAISFTPTFVVESSRPAAEVIAALSALGRQWRESSQPPIVRTIGGVGLYVRIEGSRFYVRVRGGPQRMVPACVGHVSETPNGSMTEASFVPARGSVVAGLVSLLWFGLIAWFMVKVGVLIVFLGLGFLTMNVVAWSFTARERRELQDLVAEITRHGKASAGSTPRPAT